METKDFVQVFRHAAKRNVWTRPEIEGTHNMRSLCPACDKRDECKFRAKLDSEYGVHGLVVPVFECPDFEEGVGGL